MGYSRAGPREDPMGSAPARHGASTMPRMQHRPASSVLRAVGDGAIVAGLLFAGYLFLVVAPAAGTQLSLFTPQTGRTGRLGWQLARLGLRFGEERIGWMKLEDSEATLAEARWSWRRRSAP